MDKEIEKVIAWAKKHKMAVFGIFLAVIFIGSILLFASRIFLNSMIMSRSYISGGGEYYDMDDGAYEPLAKSAPGILQTNYEARVDEEASGIISRSSEYQIKRGYVTAKSKDSISDYEQISQKVKSYDGWPETMNKYDDYTQLRISASFKVPQEKFDEFAGWIVNNFDVKDANLELYKVTVERQQNEIQILKEALEMYDELLERTEKMNETSESIDVIMKITQKRLEVMRLLREYGYSVEQVEKQSNHATISVTLTQEKKIKIMPEDLGKEMRINIRNAFRSIVNMGMDLITLPLVVLVKTLTYIFYVIIIVIPLFVAYRIMRRVFKWMAKRV